MQRLTLKWMSLAAAAAVLTAGCAAGPQRAPDRQPYTGSSLTSTTGDSDACAVALGNAVAAGVNMTRTGVNWGRGAGAPGPAGAPGTVGPDGAAGTRGAAGVPGGGDTGTDGWMREATANGVIIGNIALVALPTHDQMPVSPPTPATPATPAAPAGRAGMTDTSVTGTAPAPTRGLNTGTPAGGANAAGANAAGATAIERIKVACDKVADIRVVNTSDDRRRLAEIAAAMRRGQPITDFMPDLTRMVQASTSAGGGRNAIQGPAAPPAPATTPVAPTSPIAPRATTPATPATPATPTMPATPATPPTTTPTAPGR